MSGDVERVLAEHEHLYERRAYPSHECTCGWTGSLNDNGGEDDGQGDTKEAWHAHLAEALAPVIRKAQADAWDEAVRALAWCLDNGPADSALPYVAEHNPHRADALDQGAEVEG